MLKNNLLQTTKNILADLIAFPTVSSDSNLDLINYIAKHLEGVGAKIHIFNNETNTKANIFATFGPDCDGGIVLSGHTDVVPVSDQNWTFDPFNLTEKDGKLFGRGTCDMKGFIACVLTLAPVYAQTDLKRPIHFSFTYDEETGCLGAQKLAMNLLAKNIKPTIAIIGEPTEMRIIEGHKGIYEYTITFSGLEGHGSLPKLGVNAVEYASLYVSHLIDLSKQLVNLKPQTSRFKPPHTTINVGSIHGGVAHNVIAKQCTVAWEMRPVQKSDADFVKSEMDLFANQTLLPKMKKVYPDANISVVTIGEVDGLIPTKNNTAKKLVSELTNANGAELVSFGTEAGIFQSLGMDCIVCGPGSIKQAHIADEFVSIEQLQSCLNLLEKLGSRCKSANTF